MKTLTTTLSLLAITASSQASAELARVHVDHLRCELHHTDSGELRLHTMIGDGRSSLSVVDGPELRLAHRVALTAGCDEAMIRELDRNSSLSFGHPLADVRVTRRTRQVPTSAGKCYDVLEETLELDFGSTESAPITLRSVASRELGQSECL